MKHLLNQAASVVLATLSAVLLLACEEAATDTDDETHALNPPAWIHGTWGYCDTSPIDFYWKFSDHNIELRADATVTDYREQAKSPGVTVTEDQGQDWYHFEVQGTDGTAIGSNRFARDGSRLRWTTSTGGTSTTLTICRT
ncbi:MAG: hypothetical protein OXC12_06960 [Spirochaetaceae bacterium]|nr:hypothetical protein [Spirochaetaceae bacterium]